MGEYSFHTSKTQPSSDYAALPTDLWTTVALAGSSSPLVVRCIPGVGAAAGPGGEMEECAVNCGGAGIVSALMTFLP